jgi:hypothetical protein
LAHSGRWRHRWRHGDDRRQPGVPVDERRRLLAYSADKGEKLLELALGRSGSGPPITFTVDGKQRIAMLSGLGRRPTPSGPTDAKVDNPPLLYVFELDGKTPLPVMVTPPAASPKQAP